MFVHRSELEISSPRKSACYKDDKVAPSPALFTILIDELARRINAAEPDDAGIQIGEQLLRCLLYADDVVILAKSPEELQQFINIVDQFCSDCT